jgi:AcrR family transcriptional regulator
VFIANANAGRPSSDAPSSAAGLLEHLPAKILELERAGKVTHTFRRLDRGRQFAVVAAVLCEAAEAGPDGAGVRGIAARAGVSVGSLYQYFPDREGMVCVAAEIAGGLLSAELRHYRDVLAALPLREGLQAYVLAGMEWSRTHEDLLLFFARAAYQGDAGPGGAIIAPVVDELHGMVHAMLAAARERGETAAGLDLDAAARFVHGLTLALGDCRLLPHIEHYYRLLGDMSPQERAAQLAEFVLAAVNNAGGPLATEEGRG